MKRLFKKMLASLLVAAMVLTAAPLSGFEEFDWSKIFTVKVSALESTGNTKMDAFINDYRFTNGASWGNRGPYLSSWGSSQCCAYVADFVYYCFGKSGPKTGENFKSAWDIRAGDVINVGGENGGGHWFAVLKRSGNNLYVAEGNFNSKVRIGWNYTITSANSISGTGYSFSNGWHYLNGSGGGQVNVKEGVYVIQNVKDPSKVMDLRHDNTDNGNKIQLYDKVYNQVQKFKIVDMGDYYCIKSVYADKWIDISQPVYGEAYHNIQLWNENTNQEEHWVFEDAGNGNVYIRCPYYNVYIDYSGNPQNNTELVTYPYSGDTAQQWKLIEVCENPSVSIDDGTYIIQNVRDPSKVMDLRGDGIENWTIIQLFDKVYNQVQKFNIINMGSYYCIKSVYADKYIDISQPEINKKGLKIQLWHENTNDEEKWIFEDAGNGNVFIRSYYDVYIDTDAGLTENRTELKTHYYDATTSQQWKLIKVSESPSVKIENGIYFFQIASNPNKFMDILGDFKENYTPLQLYDALYNKVQMFEVINMGSYYCIKSVYADKCLDIGQPKINEAGHAIQLYDENSNNEEKWIFEDAGNGNVYIRSYYDVYIDSGGLIDNNAKLVTSKYDGTTLQQWKLIKTSLYFEQPNVSINKTKLAVSETATLSWTECEHASMYRISAWLSSEQLIREKVDVNQLSKDVYFTKPGKYNITAIAYYGNDYTDENLQWLNVDVVDNITVSFNTFVSDIQYVDKIIDLNSPYGELPKPMRLGYKFEGWFTSAIGGTEITAETIVPTTAEQTLYAHWQHDTFKVKENENIKMNGKTIYGANLLSMTETELSGLFENSNVSVSMKTDRISTGTTVNLIDDTNTVYDTLTVCIFGDVNCDGVYNGMDAVIVNCLANGMLTREQVGEAVYMAADCNHDGAINELDVELLEQAGLLLASVDQSKSEEELQTDSVYVEYLNIIDQNIDDKSDVPSATNDDSNKSEPNLIFSFICDLFAIIKRILSFIKTIFA